MKQLGPYRKYVIIAAIVQSIIVVFMGYHLFKSRSVKDHSALEQQGKQPAAEQTVTK